MIVYANVFSDDDEEKYGIADVSGAHFYQDADPKNSENKALKVHTCPSDSLLNSTVHIACAPLDGASGSEFEMKYYFEPLPWLISPLYFTLELRSPANVKLLSLRFEAVGFLPEGSASKIAIKTEDGREIEGSQMSAGEWHKIRIEYYPNDKNPEESRLKLYLGSGDARPSLSADISVGGKFGHIAEAAIVYSADGISGTQYFDDISFAVTDKKYSPLYDTETHRVIGEIYDFEYGIPSRRDFHIEMMLKRGNETALFDPATWTNATINATPSRSRGFSEILLVLSGTGSLSTDIRDYPFSEGSIFVTSPNCNREIISKKRYKILSIAGDFDQLSFIDGVAVLEDNVYNEGKKLAELVLYNRFGNEGYVNALCDAYIKFILINLERQPKNIISAIHKIIDNMENGFSNSDLSIGRLLDESGYAKDYVRSEFFAVTGMTPKKYLTGIRMKNAKALLDLYSTSMSISDVAEQCGIIDSSVFSRMFKQHFGVSPTDYRNGQRS